MGVISEYFGVEANVQDINGFWRIELNGAFHQANVFNFCINLNSADAEIQPDGSMIIQISHDAPLEVKDGTNEKRIIQEVMTETKNQNNNVAHQGVDCTPTN